ncbi:MAG: hypothetical protein JWO33_535, partial [Caulobacteraceae bacterium]|nr:hypothetical protein [Caulobacteraceae bacterium]
MPASRPAGPYPIPNVSMETWLVRFDKHGACVSPATQAALLAKLQADPDRDVIYFSHGWKTDFGGAIEQYGDFLRAFEPVLQAHPNPAVKPLFVGVTWPSRWLATSPGPQMAAGGAPPDPAVDDIREELGRALAPDEAARFYVLTDGVQLSDDEAKELAKLGLKALASAQSPQA